MKHLTHIGVLTGLAIGFMLCHVSSPKPALTSRTEHTNIQVPLKPTWIPLAVTSTDIAIPAPIVTSTESTPESTESLTNTTHVDLMAQAGINSNDYSSAEWLIATESSWNQYAVEPTTGACHLEQSLPCGKDGCLGSDAVCQLSWTNNYIIGRYGSWANAVAFHLESGYY